ncbi:MAG: hypothetical protein LQ341_003843 [Variospora aurantia]|nr:MAG: hypothetical protein LQ341_003843 [Variospora aurantia]
MLHNRNYTHTITWAKAIHHYPCNVGLHTVIWLGEVKMNISQPIASHIGSVEYGLLSPDEIQALSVKQIVNSTTFDSLLHPVAGGLYDPALGALDDNFGHIQLPVPVYHVTFMDQLLLLLKGRCEFCGYLKLSPVKISRFACKLRLVHHGLLKESQDLDDILSTPKSQFKRMTNGAVEHGSASEEEESDADDVVERSEDFVTRALKTARREDGRGDRIASKVGVIAEGRRALVKEFLAAIKASKSCGRCKGASRSFRKDRYSKIFRTALGAKEKAKNIQIGLKASNPLVKALERKKAERLLKREDREIDEGIVADIDDTTSEEAVDIELSDTDDGMLANIASEPASEKTRTKSKSQQKVEPDEYVNPQEVYASISELFDKEKVVFRLIYSPRDDRVSRPPLANMFFINFLLVPPNKYRPPAKTGEGEITEAQENGLYKSILQACGQLNQVRKDMEASPSVATNRQRDFGDFQNAWVRLQDCVNALIDSDRNPVRGLAGRQNEDGIKQKLEKKEGLFRKNMMGKRVNFAARSVISPDPNIETNEIGVPPVFAKKLTYPEPVTNHNFYELKQAVINGVERWPGAAAIENENGQVINLRTKNLEERQALANQLLAPSSVNVNGARNKKVHRHLNNGDLVIMNRQPTLHKPSMMAHRTKVLPGEKTIRMHYANCHTYNADFDGDEMNMHFPQNEVARSEALLIADTDHQYLVATSGKPLRGLIQDHISMGVWLTNRDTMFTRSEYFQLLYSCLRPENNHTITGRIVTVEPAVMRPRRMWTGKQIVTTILKNITPDDHPGLTLSGKSQTPRDRWDDSSEEATVLFKNGELLTGILDKAHLGPSGGGFVHAVYEAFGHIVAGQLLSVLGRLLTRFLNMRAFTCGMDDLDLTIQGENVRREKLTQAETIGLEVASKYVTLEDKIEGSGKELYSRLQEVLRDDDKQAGLDSVYNSRTAALSSEITKHCLPSGLRKSFPKNQMQTMTISGAKGSSVNTNLISCNLGQQVLEGRRVPVMVSGKTLPSFKPFETRVRAGGYITDRFLTGVKPQEYYFHAMAGREGLIDTAVKTSRSGYLQRCLIKGMEGLKVQYDSSIRDADGSMVQFLYGEDGLDVTKQKHLTDFKFLAENHLSVVAQLNMREEFAKLKDIGASDWNKAAMKLVRKNRDIGAMDPVLAIHNPGAVFGSTSESFATASRQYCEENPHGLIKDKKEKDKTSTSTSLISKRTFQTLLDTKYLKSVVDPGEAVGIVAGQSVGEPSTQMTLNTFHLAGHSAKNVTLGIPRLREIVMTASRFISTPSMTLELIGELDKAAGERFAKVISRLSLAEVVDSAGITEKIAKGIGYETAKIYDIRLDFFPSDEYRDAYAIETSDVLRAIELQLIPQLTKVMKKEFTRKGDAKLVKASAALPEVGKSSGAVEEAASRPEAEREGGDDDADDDGDDDATNNKQKQNRSEAISYGAPDEEEETIAKAAQRQSTPEREAEDEGFGPSPSAEHQNSEAAASDHGANDESDVEDSEGKIGTIEDRIRDKNPHVTRFAFDQRKGCWCEIRFEYDAAVAKILLLPILESCLHQSIVKSIPGINFATYSHEKIPGTDQYQDLIITQGVNLTAMHKYQSIINPHRIFTNDIAAMLDLYGVEAARNTIIREMDGVFKIHSISVDMRHLNLIADFMTRGGGFSAFNRIGIRDSVSPFMKMSFETTLQFVASAVLDGDWDTLEGPSARIVTGKVSKVGTGAFDVLMPLVEEGMKVKERDVMQIDSDLN